MINKELQEKASEYSFNIESELFNRLDPNSELTDLWKKEIEQAFLNGAKFGMKLISDRIQTPEELLDLD